jgi:hypothetical protein
MTTQHRDLLPTRCGKSGILVLIPQHFDEAPVSVLPRYKWNVYHVYSACVKARYSLGL